MLARLWYPEHRPTGRFSVRFQGLTGKVILTTEVGVWEFRLTPLPPGDSGGRRGRLVRTFWRDAKPSEVLQLPLRLVAEAAGVGATS